MNSTIVKYTLATIDLIIVKIREIAAKAVEGIEPQAREAGVPTGALTTHEDMNSMQSALSAHARWIALNAQQQIKALSQWSELTSMSTPHHRKSSVSWPLHTVMAL